MPVVDKPWNASAGRFTDDEYQRSCVLDRKMCGGGWTDKPSKTRCSLPIREPNGDINKNGVHAAAQRLGSVTNASSASIAAAKTALRSAYKTIGEEPPASLGSGDGKDQEKSMELHPSRERALAIQEAGWELRSDDSLDDGYIGLLRGHFAVFGQWTEIDSYFEGRFMESIAAGAFSKTFDENRDQMRCLFQHGRDPQIGMKPIGPIQELSQDDVGAYYEVGMMDTTYNRDLEPGLRSGQYGASFRFQVIREDVENEPARSEFNPDGIPQRTIREARVQEFGPVTFGAYPNATSGMRALDAKMLEIDLTLLAGADPERVAQFIDNLRGASHTEETEEREEAPEEVESREEEAPSEDAPSEAAPDDRVSPTRLRAPRVPLKTTNGTEVPSWRL